jgi:hypothetical protein
LAAGGRLDTVANRVKVRPETVRRWIGVPASQSFLWQLDFESKVDCRDDAVRRFVLAFALFVDRQARAGDRR